MPLSRLLIKYSIAYVVLITLGLLLPLIPLGLYVTRVVIVPSLVMVTVLLIGDAVRGRSDHAYNVLRIAVAPALFVYLSLGSLSSILASSYRAYSTVISYLVDFITLVLMSAFVIRLSNRYVVSNYGLSQSLRYLAYSLAFLGLGYLFSSAYSLLFYPFLATSIMYLALTPIPALSKAPGGGLGSVISSTRALAAAAFAVGLFYTVLSIPKPPQWNTYLLIAFLILASIAIAYTGYRVLTGSLSVIESIEEEIYESHKRELRFVPSPEYALFEEAVREFVAHGKKDKLIAYLTHELSRDGLEYEEILSRLDRLINYSSAARCGGRVSRRLIELEVRDRMELVNDLLTRLMGGGGEVGEGGH